MLQFSRVGVDAVRRGRSCVGVATLTRNFSSDGERCHRYRCKRLWAAVFYNDILLIFYSCYSVCNNSRWRGLTFSYRTIQRIEISVWLIQQHNRKVFNIQLFLFFPLSSFSLQLPYREPFCWNHACIALQSREFISVEPHIANTLHAPLDISKGQAVWGNLNDKHRVTVT